MLACSPTMMILVAVGILNVIVLKTLMEEEDTEHGPLIYHHVEIGCDIFTALMAVPGTDWSLGTMLEGLHFAFKGK